MVFSLQKITGSLPTNLYDTKDFIASMDNFVSPAREVVAFICVVAMISLSLFTENCLELVAVLHCPTYKQCWRVCIAILWIIVHSSQLYCRGLKHVIPLYSSLSIGDGIHGSTLHEGHPSEAKDLMPVYTGDLSCESIVEYLSLEVWCPGC